MPEGFMRIRAVQEATGLGRSTIYRLIKQGRFPKPVHPLNDSTTAWLSSEIKEWQQAVIAKRDDEAA